MLSSLAEEPVVIPSSATTPSLRRPEAQSDTFREVVDRCLERLLAHDNKCFSKLYVVKDRAAELDTSLNSSAVRACCLEEMIAKLKAVQAKYVWDAPCRFAADQYIWVDVLQEEVAVPKKARKNFQAKHCVVETHALDWAKSLCKHLHMVRDHHLEIR